MKKELICITCPIGCRLDVTCDKEHIIDVQGNTCPRGVKYAEKEIFHPERVVTTTVRISGSGIALLPVKTAGTIPKELAVKVLKLAFKVSVQAPVKAGDVIIKDVLNTGIDLVATRSLS
ncbi:MAG: DUF1667 domain-containing protein [Candidatus Omnitrophica bacterium]|nr:DUF1667 domain-containing protein [Candidatus Omnitrophota bacterium]MBU1127787.1 DUF1667 domain-containing protein [Candidatus Omnitrophota bacterium]MBU1656590.1 DUF1667 domain-containing protein [Candidatus Omnitrophota bacterium]MBU1784648.1 DUF1667 domain-containing protein [Candidatus Omnitrophota bacterium]MBU1852260.1 DUF1667 domain-containing protein [Candidatus Omnitrophota bacterium]